jgi:hypothetical protein
MLLASDYDKSKFLKATDLVQEKKFRIKTVTEEELGVGNEKEKKLCVWFTNDPRALVLNKTNNRALRGAFGDNTAGWVGKIILLFPTMVDVRGKLSPALRVRIPAPKVSPSGNGAAAAAPPPPAAAPTVADPELEPDPKLSAAEEMNDSIDF